MHLPFLTVMEQFNIISEGSRAAGKACVMREGYPAPLSGDVWEQRVVFSAVSKGEEWVRQPIAGPPGLGAESGEGGWKRGKAILQESCRIWWTCCFTLQIPLPSKYRVMEAVCPGGMVVKKTALGH